MPGQGTYAIPVSNGILEHCEQIGVAIWVFLWMLDRTTVEAPGEDGQIEGLVYGGRPVPARDIANDLRLAPRVVHLHIARLLEHGYIRKIGSGDGAPAGYCVLKSKKWTNRTDTNNREENYAVGAKKSSNTANLSSRTAKKITQTAKKITQTAKNFTQTAKNSSPYKGNLTYKTDSTSTKSKAVPFIAPAWLPLDSWSSYLEMRHEKRKDPTERAKELVVRELDKLRASGQDPGAVLDQSTRSGWTDVYALKGANGNGTNHGKLSAGEQRELHNKKAFETGTKAAARRLGFAEEDDSELSRDGE